MADNNKPKLFNELLFENEKKYADVVYLRQPIKGVWYDITWSETMLRARKVTTFLKKLGLKKGDKVSIFSKNCAEWFIADFAIALGGFISVPLYATQHKDNIRYVLDHAEVKVIFVGKLDNWQDQQTGIPDHITRIAFPYENSMPASYQWNDILAENEPDMENYVPKPDDLYTIMYTSGTTGNPKGVMIDFQAQANMSNTNAQEPNFLPNEINVWFSYMPLGHIFERSALEYISVLYPSRVGFAESLATFQKDLAEISPTIFYSVPRLWSQFQKGVLAKIPQHKLDILLKIPIVNYFIKKKIKNALGLGKTRLFGSGSAPLSPAIIEWYKTIGIEILEGYGRTEDLTVVAISKSGKQKIGYVGPARPGVEVKISEEGELLTRSNMMMRGYYKDPEATQKAFTKDGFLRTGDLAEIDEEGSIRILGRVGDSFKTDKGEFVAPIPIEGKFGNNTYIEQLCLIGLTLPQPVLLVVLSETARKTNKEVVEKSLKETLMAINPGLTNFEKVSHILIVKEYWTPENNLLTPTLKMKRASLQAKYIDFAHKAILNPDPIVWE